MQCVVICLKRSGHSNKTSALAKKKDENKIYNLPTLSVFFKEHDIGVSNNISL